MLAVIPPFSDSPTWKSSKDGKIFLPAKELKLIKCWLLSLEKTEQNWLHLFAKASICVFPSHFLTIFFLYLFLPFFQCLHFCHIFRYSLSLILSDFHSLFFTFFSFSFNMLKTLRVRFIFLFPSLFFYSFFFFLLFHIYSSPLFFTLSKLSSFSLPPTQSVFQTYSPQLSLFHLLCFSLFQKQPLPIPLWKSARKISGHQVEDGMTQRNLKELQNL